MNKLQANQRLQNAMSKFEEAFIDLKFTVDEYEEATGSSINDLPGFVRNYPFDKSLDELTIGQWVTAVAEGIQQRNFKVLSYQYLNTGGNTMVGIHEVWLPAEKRVVYVYTNEEGSTISTVDYIRHDLDIDDYDELVVDYVDWGRITGHEIYFELYRHCYNQYLVDDCRHFGYTRGVQYLLLSDQLQQAVSADYLVWLEAESDGLIRTDGCGIIVDPDYQPSQEDDKLLEAINEFKRWHSTVAGDEKYYSENYKLEFAGHKIELPFNADVWDAVDDLLNRTIIDW